MMSLEKPFCSSAKPLGVVNKTAHNLREPTLFVDKWIPLHLCSKQLQCLCNDDVFLLLVKSVDPLNYCGVSDSFGTVQQVIHHSLLSEG